MAKVYFIDTENMNCMTYGHAIHVPSINEIYLGPGPCIINAGENTVMLLFARFTSKFIKIKCG
jgi:hypothetical protein